MHAEYSVRPSGAVELAAPLQLMVVDDDEELRLVLGHLLESHGYGVTLCADAVAGLARLRSGTLPDIIVLDLMMPTMTGWEFRIAQKREASWANIPVLAMSGDHSPQAEAIDCAAYLSKPVDQRALLDAVQRIQAQLARNRALARASEVQRLVSLGTLVGGVAHEINNPLTFMGASLTTLQRQLTGELPLDASARASVQHAVESIRVGLERVAAVVKSVSLFAFAEPRPVESLDVHEVLEASLQVASNELRHCARVVRDYTPVPRVRGNAAQLGQVFLNLLLNAVASVREQAQGGHEIRVQSSRRGEHVVITIADSASTLRLEHEGRSFDPLLADRDAERRIGLRFGLTVSHELIEAMGGTMEIEPNQPQGSRLLVLLPSCGKVAAPPTVIATPPPPEKRPRVLVIDDEPLICQLFTSMLEADHDLRACTDPLDGLAACEREAYDVVLCDVMMPGLDGIALFERAVALRPALRERFVFVTGGVFSEPARSGLSRTQRPVLLKPCGRRELVAAIRTTLATAPSRVAV